MEVLVFLTLFYFASTAFVTQNLAHVESFIQEKRNVLKRKYRPFYHISSPVGWLNSPSGFSYFKNRYHVFYQYHPYNGAWGAIHWGQAISENLVDWIHYPPAIIPKDLYDKHGCLSGSTVIQNNYLTAFYTGQVLSNNKTHFSQNLAITADGIMFQKYVYNPLISQPPPDVQEIKNPKVWRFRNRWFMIIGSSTKSGHGQILLYTSSDMYHWKYNSTAARSYGDMGYLWENPDFFEIDGHHILILSVQGIQGDSYRFKNLHHTGYVIGNFDYQTLRFENMEVSLATFTELDYGHDFYAAQTVAAADGRRLLIAWLGMSESDFVESNDGWASLLTILREVTVRPNGRLMTAPVREMTDLRTEVLENAWYRPGEAFDAGAKSFELIVNASSGFIDVAIIFEWCGERQYSIIYSADRGSVSVDRGGVDGVRKADWVPDGHLSWRVFVDSSSIEVFCGEGEVAFSSRIYPKKGMRIKIGGRTQLHITQYKLRRSVGYDDKLKSYLKTNFDKKAQC